MQNLVSRSQKPLSTEPNTTTLPTVFPLKSNDTRHNDHEDDNEYVKWSKNEQRFEE